jgi:hypothetical protein
VQPSGYIRSFQVSKLQNGDSRPDSAVVRSFRECETGISPLGLSLEISLEERNWAGGNFQSLRRESLQTWVRSMDALSRLSPYAMAGEGRGLASKRLRSPVWANSRPESLAETTKKTDTKHETVERPKYRMRQSITFSWRALML